MRLLLDATVDVGIYVTVKVFFPYWNYTDYLR